MRNKKYFVWVMILLTSVALAVAPHSVKHSIFPVIAVICGPFLILLGLLPLCSARARDRMVRPDVDFAKAKKGFFCLALIGIVSLVIGVCDMIK